jgi:hypothetical protein
MRSKRRAVVRLFVISCMGALMGAPLQSRGDATSAYADKDKGVETSENLTERPSIESQTVMLYYHDLAAPAKFYGETLGLEQTQDFGFVKFFRVSPGAEVGIVKAGPGAYYTPQPKNAVMLSIITTEVDAWYKRLKARPATVFLVDIHTSKTAPIRNFMVRDPGGYTVEFFQWLESTAGAEAK